jgi:Neocarzinostatin family
LLDGQVVLVVGTHFPKRSSVVVRECLVNFSDLSDCIVNIVNPNLHQTDGAGAFSARLTVHKRIAGVECGRDKCMVVASQPGTTPSYQADAAISFA